MAFNHRFRTHHRSNLGGEKLNPAGEKTWHSGVRAGAFVYRFWGEDHSFGLSDRVSRLLRSLSMIAVDGRPKRGL